MVCGGVRCDGVKRAVVGECTIGRRGSGEWIVNKRQGKGGLRGRGVRARGVRARGVRRRLTKGDSKVIVRRSGGRQHRGKTLIIFPSKFLNALMTKRR